MTPCQAAPSYKFLNIHQFFTLLTHCASDYFLPSRYRSSCTGHCQGLPKFPNSSQTQHYLPILWCGRVFIQHVAIEGLATAGGIQGTVTDTCLRILAHHNIKPVAKWVDDFIFFQELALLPSSQAKPNQPSPFQYNLSDVFAITNPLGIPWHNILKKGQDFTPHFSYVGFHWDIAAKSVSVPKDKCFRALQKLTSVINTDSLV